MASILPAQNFVNGAAAGFEQKLQRVERNAASTHPDQTPTEFSEAEINSYVASNAVQLPAGIQSVNFQGEPDVVTANTRVDFDKLKAGNDSSNPLLGMFSGIHDVVVVAHAYGAGGKGYVNVDKVALDEVEIPRFVLQAFLEKYVQPKYPEVGLDSTFTLPDRIDIAKVGLHKLVVTQK
ncbi:MAG TPA: hypothetical protein VFA68_07980 [Terriglobales bacterium]|nr:hypothetical protein [Terriglobales bacterium]